MGSTICSAAGLVFDMFGALLLLKYALPDEVTRHGQGSYFRPGRDEEEVGRWKIYKRRAGWGMWLVILGFGLQFIGTVWK